VLSFDRDRGLLEVEAGIEWPELVRWYLRHQRREARPWGIRQKQTGADRLTLGGAVAANAHGRGLRLPPLVGDVESLTLLDAEGRLRRCSRSENRELFELVIGGYGCLGIVYSLVLRLTCRRVVERVVEERSIEGLDRAFAERIEAGFLFGDFQFKTDDKARDFLQTGVLACYRPVEGEVSALEEPRRLARSRWQKLLELAHVDKARAYELYSSYYLSTDGQRYGSDTHQLSPYLDDYHRRLDRRLGAAVPGSEMISEVYVPRARLAEFMGLAAESFRRARIDVIYGTVRLIEPDTETFLAWAREAWASIVFNFHVDHSEAGIARARRQFRLLIDLALAEGGSYFLTYHRWATRSQVEAAYPQMPEFLRRKLEWDSDERFQSDWYRHYRDMFADRL
jgi:FAD/FMN-containing dehydrogenase